MNTRMFRKILIVNRGEIAVRIIRACRDLGIRTAVMFSEADRTAMHVRMADEAYSLPGNTPAESYLRQDRIIEIAKRSAADAVHPGYGFLSENPEFAERVESEGIKFIGPSARAIRALGDKTAARKVADRLQIPTVPGTSESVSNERQAYSIASKVGYPVLLKAAAGGGGKGMRIVRAEAELANSFRTAKSEAENAFGDDHVYIEKYIAHPRHVEIQILSDSQGNAVYLGERECSIQRRHQKLIEETPSTIVDNEMRKAMGESAVRLVQAVDYGGAGTVEYLVDEHGHFFFLEVNTRLQVEHPVTEMVTGIDLVHQQILVSAGERLSVTQAKISPKGHSIECRICAEDPQDSFFPSTGLLLKYSTPQGPNVRVDNGFSEGDSISTFYDPLMAKVITWGSNRSQAIETMKRALAEFMIQGVKSTIPFCVFAMNNKQFCDGDFNTDFVKTVFNPKQVDPVSTQDQIAAAVTAALLQSGAQTKQTVFMDHQSENHSTWKTLRLESYR